MKKIKSFLFSFLCVGAERRRVNNENQKTKQNQTKQKNAPFDESTKQRERKNENIGTFINNTKKNTDPKLKKEKLKNW